MTTSTDLTVATAADIEAINAQQDSEFSSDMLTVPILKVGEALTKEVQNGDAEAGEFINTLTGDTLGTKVEFIVSFYNKGRFAVKEGRTYVAFGDVIPDQWKDLVGESYVGTLFAEYPDAEETFKSRVNAGEIPWGHGPLISTTHNYTGLVIVPALEGTDDEEYLDPVRLSLKRTNVPAAKKINSLKQMRLRNKPFWDLTFLLSTERKTHAAGNSHLVNVKEGRPTTVNEKGLAFELAQAVMGQRVVANDAALGDGEGVPTSEPDSKGGLAV